MASSSAKGQAMLVDYVTDWLTDFLYGHPRTIQPPEGVEEALRPHAELLIERLECRGFTWSRDPEVVKPL
jgi:hypothetical protein